MRPSPQIEMALDSPHWLSGRRLEELTFHLDEYATLHEEFMSVFEEGEVARYQSRECLRVLRASWESGACWYLRELDSPSTLPALFTDYIQPRFAALDSESRGRFKRVLAPFRDFGTAQFLLAKVGEQEEYSRQIRRLFSADQGSDGET